VPTGPTAAPGTVAGSLSVAPGTLTFASTASAAQQFTLSSTIVGAPAPTVNAAGCAPVVTITGGGTTLPATFTATATANGACTIVLTVGTHSVAIGITVGPAVSPVFSNTGTPLSLAYPGGSGSYSVTVTTGTIAFDAAACSGIAQITPSGTGTTSASFTAAAVAPGSCAVTVSDGASSYAEPITVAGSAPATGAVVSPAAVSVSASTLAPSQQISLTASGTIGQVTIDQSACTATGTKLAYFTLSNASPGTPVSLPQNGTVTAYGGLTGSCTINFVPQTGATAVLTVYVTP
jgi:hypothetical protein